MNNSLKLAAVLLAVTAGSASAQGRGRNTNGVPPGQRPAAGMCRVWVTGVAPGQQSAATDCATAEAQARVTANSRVIYGGAARSTMRTYTRKRQLANGSWVLDRFRRDANGNVSILSTTPLTGTNANGTWNRKRGDDGDENGVNKAQRKAEKREMKAERKRDKREMKNDRDNRDDDENGMRGAKHENKGKGKHENEERDDDDNDNG